MSMNRDEYRAYVGKLEQYARQNPRAYRFRVGLLAALGYGYLFLVLVLTLALVLGIGLWLFSGHINVLAIKFEFFLVILAGIIIRSMWVTFPRPQGIALERDKIPQLFAMLDEVTTQLKSPRFHHVVLDGDFNAAVAQVPRLGIFGWQTNYLILGLPLMQSLTPAQFRAIISHEVGHLSGNHGRFSGWIYRVRMTWAQILERLESRDHSGALILYWFINWYAPFFGAYSFALARGDEYVADHCAVEVVGAKDSAHALMNTWVKNHYLDNKYWSDLGSKVLLEATPPTKAFSNLSNSVHSEVSTDDAVKWLREALNRKTDYDDTHPSLSDRLAAIGYPQNLSTDEDNVRAMLAALPSGDSSAATAYLGEAEASLTAELDETWTRSIEEAWKERHAGAEKSRTRLAELEEKAASATLAPEESIERAGLINELRGSDEALKMLREILADRPDEGEANMGLGMLLLGEKNDESGIAYLEKAIELDRAYTLTACSMIHDYLERQGRHEEANRYRSRAEGMVDEIELAQHERAGITAKDTFLPHDMPSETLEKLRARLREIEKVAAAYLARKQVTKLPEQPFYILAIQPQTAWYQFEAEDAHTKLLGEVLKDLDLDISLYVVPLAKDFKWLEKKLQPIKDAKIYERAG